MKWLGARGPNFYTLLAVLGVAGILRLSLAFRTPAFLEGDSQSYLLPAWDLFTGQGFSPEIRRAPVYPLLIAAVFSSLGGSLSALAAVQHLVGLGTVACTYLAANHLFGRFAAAAASLAVAVSGPLLVYERYVMSEAVFTFLVIASLASLLISLSRPGVAGLVVAGALLALACLTRPLAQALVPLALITILLHLPRWRRALIGGAAFCVGFLLLFAPWSLRMLAEHGSPGASGGLGRSLVARSGKYAPEDFVDWKWLSETYVGREDREARARILLYNKRRAIRSSRSVRSYQDALIDEVGVSAAEADALMRSVGLEAIARRPIEYILDSLRFTGEVLAGIEISPHSEWKQRQEKSWTEQWPDRLDALVDPVSAAQQWERPTAEWLLGAFQPSQVSLPLLALAALGCLAIVRTSRERYALALPVSAVALASLSAFLDGPVARYHNPLEPIVALFGAGGLVYLFSLARSFRPTQARSDDSGEPAIQRAS